MPIYDYVCSSCSTRTEFIHGIDAPSPRFCPACGAEDTLRKVFASPAVHFKGSGWAKKDRSSSSSSKTKAAAATGSGDGSTGSASASEGGGSSAGEGGGSSARDGGSSTGEGGSGGSKKAPGSGSAESTTTATSGQG